LHACDFSYTHYIETLNEIKKNQNFTNFKSSSSNDIILRHDVDSSLELALKIAKIENDLSISSTFFILFHSELYNPFSPSSSKIISQLRSLGHEIGLHYNGSIISQIKKDPSDVIKNEIKAFEEHFGTSISVVSAHDPSISKKLQIDLPEGNNSMQVLTHPIWWTEDNKGWEEIMKSFVGGESDNHKIQVENDVEKYKEYLQKMSTNKV